MRSIRVRLFTYLLLLFVGSFIILFSIISTLITREYLAFEGELIVKEAAQIQRGYQDLKSSLHAKATDWSQWDDSYEFMKTKDKKFIISNLTGDTVCKLKLNYILYIDLEGEILAQKGCNLKTNTSLPLPDNLNFHLSKGRLLVNHPKLETYTGLIETPQGPLLLTAQPILTSDGKGPVRGTLIFASYFTPNSLIPYTNPEAHISFETVQGLGIQESVIDRSNEKIISSRFDLQDIYGSPSVRVISSSKRDVFERRIVTFGYLSLGLMWVGLSLILGLYYILEQLVAKKIVALIQATSTITKSKSEYNHINIPSITRQKDEFYTLQTSLNIMLESLRDYSSVLLTEQQKAQQYIDAMNTIVRVLDKNFKIILINKKGCELLGYSKAELMGKSWIDTFVLPDQQKSIVELLTSIYTNESSHNDIENQSEVLLKSGEKRLIRWHHSQIRDAQGGVISIVSSGFDITEELNMRMKLDARIKETEQLNRLMINRELAMIELKKKIRTYEA